LRLHRFSALDIRKIENAGNPENGIADLQNGCYILRERLQTVVVLPYVSLLFAIIEVNGERFGTVVQFCIRLYKIVAFGICRFYASI
jgi:hypothetical protein